MSVRQLYLKSGLFSFGGKLIASFAALAVIWLTTRIAGKEGFGEIMIAYALIYVISASIAGQFQTIVLYHTSRDGGTDTHRPGAALFYGIITGVLTALILTLISSPLAHLINKPDIAPWFATLSWMIPAFAANSILCTWYRARQDVSTMVIYFEILPPLIRAAILAIILNLSAPASWIAPAYICSYLFAFAALYVRQPIRLRISPRHFTTWDMRYSAQMLINQIMSKSLPNIVVFLLGILASATVVADYTLAMKFGQFLQLPKLAMTQIQMPRMGAQIENNQKTELMHEFDATRALSLAATIFGTAIFIIAMPFVFLWFGDFSGAYNLFLMLALSAIIMAAFGGVGNYLSMAGYAGTNLSINAISLAALLLLILALVPLYSGIGAAIATAFGSLVLMGLMTYVIYKRDNLNMINTTSLIQTATCALIISLTTAGLITAIPAALMLVAVALSGLLTSRPALNFLLPA